MDLSGKDRSLVTLGCLLVRLAALRVAEECNTVQQSSVWTVALGRQWAYKTTSSDAHICWQSVLFQFFLHPFPTLLKLNSILVEETSDCSSLEFPLEPEVWKPSQVCCANYGSLVERMLKPCARPIGGTIAWKSPRRGKAGNLALHICVCVAGLLESTGVQTHDTV